MLNIDENINVDWKFEKRRSENSSKDENVPNKWKNENLLRFLSENSEEKKKCKKNKTTPSIWMKKVKIKEKVKTFSIKIPKMKEKCWKGWKLMKTGQDRRESGDIVLFEKISPEWWKMLQSVEHW